MTVGDRIRARRKELGLTQEELGDKLGYKRSAVCKLEKEENNITIERISKIASVLETTPGYLLGWDEHPAVDYEYTFEKANNEITATLEVLNSRGRRKVIEYAKDITMIDSYKNK